MNKIYTIAIPAVLIVAILVGLFIMSQPAPQAEGAAFPGTSSLLKVATTTSVGPQAVPARTIFQMNGECKSRIVTTRGGSEILISFGEPATPGNISSSSLTSTVGHIQAGSTTVAYDSGIYGCGRWTAFAGVSTTITVSEF